MKTRVAFIGAGIMADTVHYPSLASFDDVEIAGICDLNPERLDLVANKYHIKQRFSDYRKMIEATSPEAVYAIGPPQHMYDIWVGCLNEGLNLYVEKPLGLTLHQSRMLAHLAEKNNCITQVGFQRRSCPMVVKLREECLRRGPISHAVCRFYKNALSPFTGASGHMHDDGVHAIDTLRWMCGGEIVEISSVTSGIQVPDINFIAALLSFDNGSTGLMVNSWCSGRRIFDVEMHAPGICVEAEHENKGTVYADGDTKGIEHDTREIAGSDELFVYGGFQAKHREFLDCLRERRQPGSHFGDALKTMETAEKILAKAALKT